MYSTEPIVFYFIFYFLAILLISLLNYEDLRLHSHLEDSKQFVIVNEGTCRREIYSSVLSLSFLQ